MNTSFISFTQRQATKVYGGAIYYGPAPFHAYEVVVAHLLALPWETKRTARHELFLSDAQLSYAYGGKASCPACGGKGTQEHLREGLAAQTINCPACKGEGTTRPSYTAKPRGMMEILNSGMGTEFNAIFLNKYDDEKQHLGWHADDFEGMRKDQPIAVISYGAEREIWLKHKQGFECPDCGGADMQPHPVLAGAYQTGTVCGKCDGGWVSAPPNARQPLDQRVKLEQGSIFVMPVGYQDTHLHRIPKHDRPCGWRISLTFRSFAV
jgi:transcription elongation factor Elf1